ncbi:MAG: type I restriction enzyme HsdR N-terminal domain-containing protein [Salibacteraceae bacterium]
MQELNLPQYEFKLKPGPTGPLIFDSIRKKFLVLTPEEWVRQNYIEYLHFEFGYPKSLMRLEQPMKYNRMDKRSDIVCYGNGGNPLLIVECKRPTVKITQKTFDQIARYNMVLKVPYMAVTNGLTHFYCKINHEEKTYLFIEAPLEYEKLV